MAVADINLDAARKAAAEIAQRGGGRAWAVGVDVTDKRSVEKMVEATLAEFGRVDILVNNAGIAPSFPLADFPEADWDRTVAVNLKGYFLCAQAVARALIRQGRGGSIVNISSKSGVRGSADNSAYNATKFGVIGLAQGWAQELAKHRIRVNSVLPGNVIRGSGIWSEEYLRARAGQAGIAVGAGRGILQSQSAARPAVHAGGRGERRRVPRLGPCLLHHRLLAPGGRRAGNAGVTRSNSY